MVMEERKAEKNPLPCQIIRFWNFWKTNLTCTPYQT
jgi:hypothetical protein